ncbi:hypothetical protein GCM10009733_083440 [Nonomuraea maheshkhaliensis]|uniref:MerR family transcriptional regulator n=1 Tax=Nonomuraea maheshkhaliensis TaxID=419590 RepID=A0ABN2GME7_9ACTN
MDETGDAAHQDDPAPARRERLDRGPDEQRARGARPRGGTRTLRARHSLLRRHRGHITDRIQELHRCLDLVSRKVALYEEHLAGEHGDPLWTGPCPTDEQPPPLD